MNKNYINYFILFVLIIIIGLFSTKVEKSYPDFMIALNDEPLYKFISLYIIVFITNYNFQIGILLSIIFLFTIADIGLLSNINENFTGPPLNSSNLYNPEDTKKIGTAFYPLNNKEIYNI